MLDDLDAFDRRLESLTYPQLVTEARQTLQEALAVAERDGYRASMRLILHPLGVRDSTIAALNDGTNLHFGLDPWPPLPQETAKQLLWSVLEPEATEDDVAGWWENRLRDLIHRSDVALAYLAGEDWS